MLQCTGWAGVHASETSESLSPLCGNLRKSPVVPPELCSWAGWSGDCMAVAAAGISSSRSCLDHMGGGGLSENRSQVGVYL